MCEKSQTNNLRKMVPLWLVLLLLGFSATPGVWAALTVQTTTTTAIFGEIYTFTEELTVVPQGIDIATSAKSAAGTDSASPITLTAPGATVRTALTKGNYYYSVEVSIATVSANIQYNVTLYREQSDTWVYIDSLYVQQAASPSIGDKATLDWDLGVSLSSSTFKVEIETYT